MAGVALGQDAVLVDREVLGAERHRLIEANVRADDRQMEAITDSSKPTHLRQFLSDSGVAKLLGKVLLYLTRMATRRTSTNPMTNVQRDYLIHLTDN